MIPNHSPWIHQLKRTRPVVPMSADLHADTVIVGGGIAGVVTAYFTLRTTNHRVLLIEADKIAHGATGHNAGQITSYFERPLTELVEEFGFHLAIEGQRSIESGWLLLDEILAETGLQTPVYRFMGYTGISTFEQVLQHLKNNRHRVNGELPPENIILAEEWEEREKIPEEYVDLYTTVAQKDLLALLETDNLGYIGALSYQKGCMNSALFSEELIGYLIARYADRFSFYEGSPVRTVHLHQDSATLDVLSHTVTAQRVVLCTNGFENFTIINHAGAQVDTSFHDSVAGRIGYMSGYVAPFNDSPVAISYFPKAHEYNEDPTGDDYFYLTRRPHEHEGNQSYNLVCTGGPEKVLPNGAVYSRESVCSEDMRILIDDFLKDNYKKHPKDEIQYEFCWHGLMGYTSNGVRRIGVEPYNPVLLYNLGCNGVGILPSMYGGKRIAQILAGDTLEPSIFDPHD
ncbi:MAG: FAD-binding oxidoreductase [Candidatus Kerfeldbacteria bacterium]|nr:FAD-binding oxidoreductase [Candidatus Kerfeldbacteria bacterium]